MARLLRCYEIGSNCDFTVRADTEEEVFRIAQEHGRANHGGRRTLVGDEGQAEGPILEGAP